MAYEKELEFARTMARDAGEIMKKYYRIDQSIELKADHSPVTIADKEINSLLIERVKLAFPDHGVLGEEESWGGLQASMWVCDPIDGTRMYTHHVPISMFSLAYVVDGEVKAAVCLNPWTGDEYWAVIGQGAWRNDTKLSVQAEGEVSVGVWHQDIENGIMQSVQAKGWRTIPLHPVVVKGCMIAEGSLTGQNLNLRSTHDVAAISLLVSEAGGVVTDLQGNPQRYDQPVNGCVMSNGVIHEALVAIGAE